MSPASPTRPWPTRPASPASRSSDRPDARAGALRTARSRCRVIGSATRIETLMAQTQSRASAPEPTDAAAEYLMTIRYMHAEAQPVIAARLAERLGVSAATVSELVTRP